MLLQVGKLGAKGTPAFSPDQLSGLVAWYRHNTGITSSGSLVSAWADQTASGNNLLQATAANKPIDGSLGSERNTNPGFDSDTGYNKGVGWTIGSGVASCDGTQTGTTYIADPDSLEVGKTYLAVFTITALTAGTVRMRLGTTFSAQETATGTYSVVFESVAAGKAFIVGDVDFVGSVDNFSVKEITQDGSIWFSGELQHLDATFTLGATTTTFLLFKQITWALNSYIIDGYATNTLRCEQNTTTPNIRMEAVAGSITSFDLDAYGILTVVKNGASGGIRKNVDALKVAASDTTDMGGLALGAKTSGFNASNIEVMEALTYNRVLTTAEQDQVINYLNTVDGGGYF